MSTIAFPLSVLTILALFSRKQSSRQARPTARDSDAVRAAKASQRATKPALQPDKRVAPRKTAPASAPLPVSRTPKPAKESSVNAATAAIPRAVPPPGYDRLKAANSAPDIARHIKQKGYNYTRKALKAWQIVAGVTPDGLYGPSTREALVYYVGNSAPKALFKGVPLPYPWGM
jgi:murein L,D-transpeptidase YcbB/YkuD